MVEKIKRTIIRHKHPTDIIATHQMIKDMCKHAEIFQNDRYGQKYNYHTIKCYTQRAKYYVNWCIKNDLDYKYISRERIGNFITHLQTVRKCKNATVNQYLKGIKYFYRFAMATGLTPKYARYKGTKIDVHSFITPIIDTMKLLKFDKFIKKIYVPQEILFEFCDVLEAKMPKAGRYSVGIKHTPIKYKAILYLMRFSGARISEIVSLQRKDINLTAKDKYMIITRTKNRREPIKVKLYLADESAQAVQAYFDSDPIVKARKINNVVMDGAFNITSNYFVETMTRWKQKKYGYYIDDYEFTTHCMRRSYAADCYKMGVDIHQIAWCLGISVSQAYRYSEPSTREREIMQRINIEDINRQIKVIKNIMNDQLLITKERMDNKL